MTPAYILLLFFQCCCVSGQLVYNFSPLANLALKVSVDEVNRQSSNFNLHRPTSSVVRQETVCLKYTRRPYRNSCRFKQGRLAKLCSSLVRVGSMSVAPLGISCMVDTAAFGSSSESSSEEVIIRRTGRLPLGSLS